MDEGIAITSVIGKYPCYVGSDKLVYTNAADGDRLYLKSATANDNGRRIISSIGIYSCYIGNGQLVYRNESDGGKLYLKSIYENWT